jgi:hypothetical protein
MCSKGGGYSRAKLGDAFVESLQRKWEADGDLIVELAAKQDPVQFMNVIARVLPKELALTVEQKTPGNLEPEAWATLRRVLDLIEQCKVDGDPQQVFAAIEEDLRARMAVPVESK